MSAQEQAWGLVVSVGGQIPQNLAKPLHDRCARVLGTSPDDIDRAEDRHKFSSLLDDLGVDQPPWRELQSVKDAQAFAAEVEYPVLVRPSFVLSGADSASKNFNFAAMAFHVVATPSMWP